MGGSWSAWNFRWIFLGLNTFRNLISDSQIASSLGDDIFLDSMRNIRWFLIV